MQTASHRSNWLPAIRVREAAPPAPDLERGDMVRGFVTTIPMGPSTNKARTLGFCIGIYDYGFGHVYVLPYPSLPSIQIVGPEGPLRAPVSHIVGPWGARVLSPIVENTSNGNANLRWVGWTHERWREHDAEGHLPCQAPTTSSDAFTQRLHVAL